MTVTRARSALQHQHCTRQQSSTEQQQKQSSWLVASSRQQGGTKKREKRVHVASRSNTGLESKGHRIWEQRKEKSEFTKYRIRSSCQWREECHLTDCSVPCFRRKNKA